MDPGAFSVYLFLTAHAVEGTRRGQCGPHTDKKANKIRCNLQYTSLLFSVVVTKLAPLFCVLLRCAIYFRLIFFENFEAYFKNSLVFMENIASFGLEVAF
jgi:hypothetical protein